MLNVANKRYIGFIQKLINYKLMIYIFDGVIWTIAHSMPLILGIIIKDFFNEISSQNASANYLIWLILCFVLSSIFRIAIIHLGARVDIYHKFQISSFLYKNILSNIYKDKNNFNKNYAVGEMIDSSNTDVAMLEGTISLILDALGHLIFTIMAVVILLSISVKLTLLIVLPIIVVIILASYTKNIIKKLRSNNRILSSKIAGFTSELFESSEEVKLSGSENEIIKYLEKLYEDRCKAFSKDTLFTNLLKNLYSSTVDIGTGILLIVMAIPLVKGEYNIGDFVIFIYYTYYIVDFAQYLGGLLSNFIQCDVSIKRLHDIFNSSDPEDYVLANNNEDSNSRDFQNIEKEGFVNSIIKFTNMPCNYVNESNSIKEISFKVEPKTITVIAGENASGKSTILKAIMGYVSNKQGKIIVEDKEINCFDARKHKVVYLPQNPKLINDTIKNNILLGIEIEEKAFNSILFKSDLVKDMGDMEAGINTNVGPMGGKLSGGQLQRVALARSFIRDADLYIIDDIPNALDINTEENIINRLYLNKDKTFIIASNNEKLLKGADNIIVLQDGKIECEGNYDYIIKNSKEIKKLLANKAVISE